jgi:hypothetical protein
LRFVQCVALCILLLLPFIFAHDTHAMLMLALAFPNARATLGCALPNLTPTQHHKLSMLSLAFVERLSRYFQHPAAMVALEWLVRRFTVHEDNIRDVVACILPYHSAKAFVRTVQVSVDTDT